MKKLQDELKEIAGILRPYGVKIDSPEIAAPLTQLSRAAKEIGESSSGSWNGYQARVYYKDFQSPPRGNRFSKEWGLDRGPCGEGSLGDWVEDEKTAVQAEIEKRASEPSLDHLESTSAKARDEFESARTKVISILEICTSQIPDGYIKDILSKVKELHCMTRRDLIELWKPRGYIVTSDVLAMNQGTTVPPHVSVLADVAAWRAPFDACSHLSRLAQDAFDHLQRIKTGTTSSTSSSAKIFIGHGRSKVWKDLKDFIQDRLHLEWDEFNRIPVAGETNIARLSEMLNSTGFAFIIMTAEDERIDGRVQARLNVVHEAGLFQGRLGFKKAIVLLEEGCETFSNIEGLGHIPFPRDNIQGSFEEIRRVLEREKLLML